MGYTVNTSISFSIWGVGRRDLRRFEALDLLFKMTQVSSLNSPYRERYGCVDGGTQPSFPTSGRIQICRFLRSRRGGEEFAPSWKSPLIKPFISYRFRRFCVRLKALTLSFQPSANVGGCICFLRRGQILLTRTVVRVGSVDELQALHLY